MFRRSQLSKEPSQKELTPETGHGGGGLWELAKRELKTPLFVHKSTGGTTDKAADVLACVGRLIMPIFSSRDDL